MVDGVLALPQVEVDAEGVESRSNATWLTLVKCFQSAR